MLYEIVNTNRIEINIVKIEIKYNLKNIIKLLFSVTKSS